MGFRTRITHAKTMSTHTDIVFIAIAVILE